MRRWNGWGDDSVHYPVTPETMAFLEKKLGPGKPPKDISLSEAVAGVPVSRLPEHPLISTDALERLRHSAGQSLADWINLRGGTVPAFPDGVAFPATEREVRAVLRYAQDTEARVIPYGGGTSVVGHLSAGSDNDRRPALTVDMGRINSLLELDEANHLATFEAGVRGPALEKALRVMGFTLGHYPQSHEYSTLGGWVATRSAGQFSLGYGRIERLFAGGMVETPVDSLPLPVLPASAAGPDLREIVLGSEGRLGIITRAAVRVKPLPEVESFHAAFFPGLEQGVAAVRDLARSSLPLAMLRLSLPEETDNILTQAGNSPALKLLKGWLNIQGVKEGRCMLLYGAVGGRKQVRRALSGAREIIGQRRGVSVGAGPGRKWQKQRFLVPYLRNTLWEAGYAVDTLETAVTWSRVPATVQAVESALRNGLRDIDEKVYVFTHLSHVYTHGSSIYTTYLFRVADHPAETMRRWKQLKTRASETIVSYGGTISHQHGVGVDHRAYLEAEKDDLGMEMLRSICRTMDPAGMMNPGKLL
ncbi:MAG: FAD-binding oxidoreductase [Firmicutes bacterium]|nr:FAD-binding oxidoreductase [Bacillota bacterium]